MNALREYTILETDSGPMISESRTLVYEILEGQLTGRDFYEMCYSTGLNSGQMEAAFAYIEAHREPLMAALPALQQERRDREAHDRARQEPLVREALAALPDIIRQKLVELRQQWERNGHSE